MNERSEHGHEWGIVMKAIVAGLVLLIALLRFSQVEAAWSYLTGPDGLGIVWGSTIGPAGNLWFASDMGIARYDGLTLTRFYPGYYPDPFYDVRSLTFDRRGRLWCGTQGGVAQMEGSVWTRFTVANGLPAGIVFAVAVDSLGTVWAGTEGGLARYNSTQWEPVPGTVGADRVNALLVDRAGMLWVATNTTGVHRFDGTTWLRPFTDADGLGSNQIFSLFQDDRNRIWGGTSSGPSVLGGSLWQTYRPPELPETDILAIGQDALGALWFGTGAGAARFDGTYWSAKLTRDGLPDQTVYTIARDRAGGMWFGTRYGSAARYDGASWFVDRTLAGGFVKGLSEDREGRIWVGSSYAGASWWDGTSWRTFDTGTTAGGLGSNSVWRVYEDSYGDHWFATDDARVSRLTSAGTWTSYRDSVALFPSPKVHSIYEDRDRTLWFCTDGGLVTFSRSRGWGMVTAGLAVLEVRGMLQDEQGAYWFATYGGGVARFDGTRWDTLRFPRLTHDFVLSIHEDRSGTLWFGLYGAGLDHYAVGAVTNYFAGRVVAGIQEDSLGNLWLATDRGACRLHGDEVGCYGVEDGLGDHSAEDVLLDRRGRLWFTNVAGVATHEPDYVPPVPFVTPRPPEVLASTALNVSFTAGYLETGQLFSYSFDDTVTWSSWSTETSHQFTNLGSGKHSVHVRARDKIGNIGPVIAGAEFEVDLTPPAPTISYPAYGDPVRGLVAVVGTATGVRLTGWALTLRALDRSDSMAWAGTFPVGSDTLALFDARSLPDGDYEIRLAAHNSLGLTGVASTRIVVDNHAPYADVTTPAKVPAATGGDVYTTNAEAHLYFPPHAFAGDALVTVSALADTLVLSNLPSGAARVLPGYEIGWGGLALGKPARLTLSYAGAAGSRSASATASPGGSAPGPIASGSTLALYRSADGSAWERLGGTVDAGAGRIELAITQPGRYALFAESSVITGAGALGGLAFTPRVFSPTGGYANTEVGISFTLGRPAPVTVRVYSRSGRLVREVVTGQAMNAGANLVRWDGRDRNGGFAVDGLYLVTVEALGRTERKTLAVVK